MAQGTRNAKKRGGRPVLATKDLAFTLFAENKGASEVFRILQEKHPDDAPADLRTVQGWRAEFKGMDTDLQKLYRFVRWPETFESEALPWTAAAPVLELLRGRHLNGMGRPTVREARWFVRVTQAIPCAPFRERWGLAHTMALNEVTGGFNPHARREAEWAMAYSPWTSEEAAALYDRMSKGVGQAEAFPVWGQGAESPMTAEQARAAMVEVQGASDEEVAEFAAALEKLDPSAAPVTLERVRRAMASVFGSGEQFDEFLEQVAAHDEEWAEWLHRERVAERSIGREHDTRKE